MSDKQMNCEGCAFVNLPNHVINDPYMVIRVANICAHCIRLKGNSNTDGVYEDLYMRIFDL